MATTASKESSAPAPLLVRLERIIKHSQFIWWMGHVILLLCSFRYSMGVLRLASYNSFYYSMSFFSAMMTYGIVIFKIHFSKGFKSDRASIAALAMDENVHYLLLACLWFFTKPLYMALFPYAIFSIFHMLSYLRSTIFPAIFPTPATKDSSVGKAPATITRMSKWIGTWNRQNFEPAMQLVAQIEVYAIGGLLFLGMITFKYRIFTFMGFGVFLRNKYYSNAYTRQAITVLTLRIDHLLAGGNIPPFVRTIWTHLKNFIRTYLAPPVPGMAGSNPSTANRRASSQSSSSKPKGQ